ncbi:MAG: hypothetical protein LBF13_04680 [Campylobacteraceae bacterium]|jgi:hypothetical protein|nr:hypothetical protein [Campylobacteraceae bacterium]
MKLAQILLLVFNILVLVSVTIAILSYDMFRWIFPYWITGIFIGLCTGAAYVLYKKGSKKSNKRFYSASI